MEIEFSEVAKLFERKMIKKIQFKPPNSPPQNSISMGRRVPKGHESSNAPPPLSMLFASI